MPAIEEIVTLVVDGHELRGWQDVSIDRSMQDAAIAFSLTATNPSWSAEAKALRGGKKVEIYTSSAGGARNPGGGELMCTGYIDAYGADYAPDSKVVSVSGRSKAADAIDCPPAKHKTGRIEKKPLDKVAQELDEFGIGFRTDISLPPIPKVQIIPGEPLFAAIEREARRLGVMLYGQTDGSVLITRAGTKRHAGALVLGFPPVAKLGVKINCSAKFSPIIVRGQRAGGTGKTNLRQQVEETDALADRHRPLIIILEGDAPEKELKKRAEWERLRNAGFGVTASAEISTWRDEAGAVWDPGRLLSITVAEEDIDQDMTVSTVKFRQSLSEGTRAFLALVDPRTHGGEKPAGGKGSDKAYDPGKAASRPAATARNNDASVAGGTSASAVA